MKPANGQTVTDVVSGRTGVVIGLVEYITGCNQALIQPQIKPDGSVGGECFWCDEDRLRVEANPLVKLPHTSNGFDKAAPIR